MPRYFLKCYFRILAFHTTLQPVSAPRSCTRDEGRPLGADLQEQASNRLKLHGSRALVVSVEGKGTAKTVSGEVQGDERKRTTDEVSKTSNDDVETGDFHYSRISPGDPAYCLGGVPHRSGVKLSQALMWNVGTCCSDD